jgi:hypothetical protein
MQPEQYNQLVEKVTREHASRYAINGKAQDSQPIPLVRPVAAPAPYPIDALGPILAPAAKAIAQLVQVPEALAGNSVLAASALAAQAHANVHTLGGPRPLSLYVLTIAESGERKSTADTIACAPIRNRVATLQKQYNEALRDYEAKSEVHKVLLKQTREQADTPEQFRGRAKGAKNACIAAQAFHDRH